MTLLSRNAHAAFREWLRTGSFDYFATLTVPSHSLGVNGARGRLWRWDMRMNRNVLGNRWQKRPDERLFMFAALEQPTTNLHWHVLIRVPGDGLDEDKRLRQMARLEWHAGLQWRRLVPSGTVDIQRIRDKGIADYVAKELRGGIQYASFILPDEFRQS